MQISEACLKKLPSGSFVRFSRTQNMADEFVDVVVWAWIDSYPYNNAMRRGQFDIKTGEYLGDVL